MPIAPCKLNKLPKVIKKKKKKKKSKTKVGHNQYQYQYPLLPVSARFQIQPPIFLCSTGRTTPPEPHPLVVSAFLAFSLDLVLSLFWLALMANTQLTQPLLFSSTLLNAQPEDRGYSLLKFVGEIPWLISTEYRLKLDSEQKL